MAFACVPADYLRLFWQCSPLSMQRNTRKVVGFFLQSALLFSFFFVADLNVLMLARGLKTHSFLFANPPWVTRRWILTVGEQIFFLLQFMSIQKWAQNNWLRRTSVSELLYRLSTRKGIGGQGINQLEPCRGLERALVELAINLSG